MRQLHPKAVSASFFGFLLVVEVLNAFVVVSRPLYASSQSRLKKASDPNSTFISLTKGPTNSNFAATPLCFRLYCSLGNEHSRSIVRYRSAQLLPTHEHTVKLPDGIEILYTDSGAPESFPYTTLLLLHGSAFSGDSMVGLHQYAHKNDMRVVLWNRRGYRGSTGYTDSEIEDLKTGRRVFQDRLALQLAWFFRHFMYQENIPKVSTDRKVGGFILGGWSFGNTASLSLFGDPGVLPRDLYDYIEPYVLSLVLYDPPYTALGLLPFPNQAEVYNPWTDPDCPTAEARVENFQHWVSAYHEHPEISSGKISYTKRPERSTLASWTEEMKARYIDGEAASRCDIPAFAPTTQAMFKDQTFHALFDPKIVSSYFPEVNVLYISGAMSSYFCVWAYLETCRIYEEAVGLGEKVRRITFKSVEGGNRFMHYELPELFLRVILEGCTKQDG